MSPIRIFDSSLSKKLKISVELLDKKNRLRFITIVILNAAISFLDLIGVVLFGFVGLLLSSSTPRNTSNPIFSWLYRQVSFLLEISNGILVLALSASILLLSKNIISAVIYFRIYRFLGNLQAKISNQVIDSFFSQNRQDSPSLAMAAFRAFVWSSEELELWERGAFDFISF